MLQHWCFSDCWAVLILSQGLFSVSCSASKEGHKELGKSIAGTAEPKWPKGYSIPQNVMPSVKTGSSWPVGAHHCWGTSRASVSRWWAIALCITCGFWIFPPLSFCYLPFIILLLIILILYLHSLLFLSQPMEFTFFPILFSIPPWWMGEWASSCMILCFCLVLNLNSSHI